MFVLWRRLGFVAGAIVAVFNPDAEVVVNGEDNLIAMSGGDQLTEFEQILEGSR